MGSFPHFSESFPANDDFSAQFRNKKRPFRDYPSFPDFARDSLVPTPKSAYKIGSRSIASTNAQSFYGTTRINVNSNELRNEAKNNEETDAISHRANASQLQSRVAGGQEEQADDNADFIKLQRIGANLALLSHSLNPLLFKKVFETSSNRDRFRAAWWFVIYASNQRATIIEQLAKLGFVAPPWVAFDGLAQKPPFPVQWGNLAITVAAISGLYECYAHFYRSDINFVALFTIDELQFFRSLAESKACLFDKRAIAEALILSIDQWSGRPNFNALFRMNLARPDFSKVKFNHYRIDSIPSGNYSNLKGCIAPAIFDRLAKEDFNGLARKMAKKPYVSSGAGYRTRSQKPQVTQVPSDLYPDIEHKAPSGVDYPDKASIQVPSSRSSKPLYAPRLEYFAKVFSFPPTPARDARSFADYLSSLGRCPKFYCAGFQSSSCRRRSCDYHHLCEWCAQEHVGNACPYRPKAIALRR